jgi:hypothetical protein
MLEPRVALIPVGAGLARRVEISEQQNSETGQSELALKVTGTVNLVRLGSPANLAAAGSRRLVAATLRKVAIYEWTEAK